MNVVYKNKYNIYIYKHDNSILFSGSSRNDITTIFYILKSLIDVNEILKKKKTTNLFSTAQNCSRCCKRHFKIILRFPLELLSVIRHNLPTRFTIVLRPRDLKMKRAVCGGGGGDGRRRDGQARRTIIRQCSSGSRSVVCGPVVRFGRRRRRRSTRSLNRRRRWVNIVSRRFDYYFSIRSISEMST